MPGNRRLLFLAHRMPYPPDKGEKIRAWHILKHLSRDWDVELGFLLDRRADLDHLPVLRDVCAAVEWRPALQRYGTALKAALRLRPGRPITTGWFHDPGLAAWVRGGLATHRYGAVFVYSTAMAPYVMGPVADRARAWRVLDMVDVDSEKWRAYAADAAPVMRQVWAREARTLLALERRAARAFNRTLFVSAAEAERFVALAPDCAGQTDWVDNGVDFSRFDPAQPFASPFRGDAPAIVFTGTMGYRPNIEAVCWFAQEVLPRLRATLVPAPEFHVVGADPAPAVRALANTEGVHVTGSVPDVRPYLAHAHVAVAPLFIARGIQNKVLEAMAMARPVVATPEAFEGIKAEAGRDLLIASGAEAMTAQVAEILRGRHPGLGPAGRQAVLEGHDWSRTLGRLDRIMRASQPGSRILRPADAEA